VSSRLLARHELRVELTASRAVPARSWHILDVPNTRPAAISCPVRRDLAPVLAGLARGRPIAVPACSRAAAKA
jgi:hypothetical protein